MNLNLSIENIAKENDINNFGLELINHFLKIEIVLLWFNFISTAQRTPKGKTYKRGFLKKRSCYKI